MLYFLDFFDISSSLPANNCCIYSDDIGASWSIGGEPELEQGWNASNQLDKPEPSEADIVELTSGLLLMSARNDGDHTVNGVYYGPRIQFTGSDGGETWVWTESAFFLHKSGGYSDSKVHA